jgi:hypothetical protein
MHKAKGDDGISKGGGLCKIAAAQAIASKGPCRLDRCPKLIYPSPALALRLGAVWPFDWVQGPCHLGPAVTSTFEHLGNQGTQVPIMSHPGPSVRLIGPPGLLNCCICRIASPAELLDVLTC